MIKLRYVHSIHSQWKSKQMLATYMPRMRNNNLEIRIGAPIVARNKISSVLLALQYYVCVVKLE